MRQLPEQCEACKKPTATLETCVLPDGTEKRGAEVTFKESAEGGIRCVECAGGKLQSGEVGLRSLGLIELEVDYDVVRVVGGPENPVAAHARPFPV